MQGTVSILLLKGIEQNDSKDCVAQLKKVNENLIRKFLAPLPLSPFLLMDEYYLISLSSLNKNFKFK